MTGVDGTQPAVEAGQVRQPRGQGQPTATVVAVDGAKAWVRWSTGTYDTYADWQVVDWPIVQPLPPLPTPEFSLVSLDGDTSVMAMEMSVRSAEIVARSRREGYRTDLFVEWVPRFVDARGVPVGDDPGAPR